MSCQLRKKKAAADNDGRERALIEGILLAKKVTETFYNSNQTAEERATTGWMQEARYDRYTSLLPQASRACVLLQNSLDVDIGMDLSAPYGNILIVKASIHKYLGQPTLAVATYVQVGEVFTAAERKGVPEAPGAIWRDGVSQLSFVYLATHQLESAKRTLLRECLAWAGHCRAYERLSRLGPVS